VSDDLHVGQGEGGLDSKANCTGQVSVRFDGQSTGSGGRSAGGLSLSVNVVGLTDSSPKSTERSVSAWVGQNNSNSMKCSDGRSGSDDELSIKTSSARFWLV
jgi:hypothetical protein